MCFLLASQSSAAPAQNLSAPPPAPPQHAGCLQEYSPARLDGEVLPHVFNQLGGAVIPQAACSPCLCCPGQLLIPHLAKRKEQGQAGMWGAWRSAKEKPAPHMLPLRLSWVDPTSHSLQAPRCPRQGTRDICRTLPLPQTETSLLGL